MSYKYDIGIRFSTKIGKKGTILRIAKIDEFGADFYFAEKNYVVVFDEGNSDSWATYNFISTISPSITYNYVMTENDIIV
jgi:hypothetical protein